MRLGPPSLVQAGPNLARAIQTSRCLACGGGTGRTNEILRNGRRRRRFRYDHAIPGNNPMTRTTALIAGAGGIIGNAVAHELMRSGWTVRALGRRPVAGVPSIQADLTDAG